MVYFCLQVSFNFVCQTCNSKNFENYFDAFSHLSYFIYTPKLFDVITFKQVFVPLPLVTDTF